MYAFFKPVLLIFVIVSLFFYILINSKTVETTTEVITAPSGMPVQTTSYTWHWDRFGDYITSPRNAFRNTSTVQTDFSHTRLKVQSCIRACLHF